MGIQLLRAPHHDEKTNRYFRFIKNSDNPHHADCSICKKRCRLIRGIQKEINLVSRRHGKTTLIHYAIQQGLIHLFGTPVGLYCPTDGVIWFDLEGGKRCVN